MTDATPIKTGDKITPKDYPGAFTVEVLEVCPCDITGDGFVHDQYRIIDPEIGDDDWVCSRDVVKA